jgi:hypothetical protein
VIESRAAIKPALERQESRAVDKAYAWLPSVLKVVAFCVAYKCPASLFPALLMLFKIVANLELAPYKLTHNRYYWSLVRSFGEAILATQLAALLASPCWGFMMDSSEDVSGKENLIIFIVYVNPITFQRNVQYLCLVESVNKTADGIMTTLETMADVFKLPMDRLLTWASDGDSAFQGCNNGVVQQLKQKYCAFMVAVWCVAHRSALVMVTASKKLPWLHTFDRLIRWPHKFFVHSTHRRLLWRKFAVEHGCNILSFPVFNQTRWFGRAYCVNAIVQTYPVFLWFLSKLQHTRDEEASSVGYKLLSNINTIVFLVSMHSALTTMNVLSKRFQAG